MLNDRFGVSGVLITVLLLFVSIGAFIVLQGWFETYKSDWEVDITVKDFDSNVEIMKIDGTRIFIRNDYRNDLRIDSIKVGNRDCDVSNIVIDKGVSVVDIGGCTYGSTGLVVHDVMLSTSDGLVQEYDVIENPLESLLIVLPTASICDFSSGYVRLLGLSDVDNAHVDIDGTYTYNVCVRHLNYTLGTSSSGNFVNMLYVTDQSNSAVWTDKGSIYQAPSNWYNVSLSSSGGAIYFAVNDSDMSALGYDCVLKIDKDDVYGSHVGTCDSDLPDALWLKIE